MLGATLVMAGLVVHVFGERLDKYKEMRFHEGSGY